MALFFFCLAAAHEQHRSSEIVPAQAPRWAVAVGGGGQHRDAPSVPTAAPASPPTSSRSPPGHVCSLFQYCSLTAPNYCCCLLLRRCWCRFVQHLTARGAAPPRSQPRAVLSTRRAANCVQAEMFRGRSVGFSAGIDLRRAALLSPPPRDLLHPHTPAHAANCMRLPPLWRRRTHFFHHRPSFSTLTHQTLLLLCVQASFVHRVSQPHRLVQLPTIHAR